MGSNAGKKQVSAGHFTINAKRTARSPMTNAATQDTDLSPVPLFRGTAKYFLAYFKEIVLEDKALNLVFLYRNIVINTGVNKIRLSLRISFVYSK